jgi:hypothetical protein
MNWARGEREPGFPALSLACATRIRDSKISDHTTTDFDPAQARHTHGVSAIANNASSGHQAETATRPPDERGQDNNPANTSAPTPTPRNTARGDSMSRRAANAHPAAHAPARMTAAARL